MVNRKYLAIAGILTLSIILLVPAVMAATSGGDIPTLLKDLESKLWSSANSVKNDTKLLPGMGSQLTDLQQKLWSNINSVKNDTKLIAPLSSKLDDVNDTIVGKIGTPMQILTGGSHKVIDTSDTNILQMSSSSNFRISITIYPIGLESGEWIDVIPSIGVYYDHQNLHYTINTFGTVQYTFDCHDFSLVSRDVVNGFDVYYSYTIEYVPGYTPFVSVP